MDVFHRVITQHCRLIAPVSLKYFNKQNTVIQHSATNTHSLTIKTFLDVNT